jgi:hypothetical protein
VRGRGEGEGGREGEGEGEGVVCLSASREEVRYEGLIYDEPSDSSHWV